MISNVEVDVLGRWESGPGLETPTHVMRSLLRNGVLQVLPSSHSGTPLLPFSSGTPL